MLQREIYYLEDLARRIEAAARSNASKPKWFQIADAIRQHKEKLEEGVVDYDLVEASD